MREFINRSSLNINYRVQYEWKLVFNSLEEKVEYITPGRISKLYISNQWICFTEHKGQLYAFDEKCPHQGYSLIMGKCKNGKIICPLHQYEFDLSSGFNRDHILNVYPLKEIDGKVYIKLKKGFWG